MADWFALPSSLLLRFEADPRDAVRAAERDLARLRAEGDPSLETFLATELRHGEALRTAGDLSRALETISVARARAFEGLGAGHPLALDALTEEGLSELSLSRIAEARESLRQALTLSVKYFGENSSEVSRALAAFALSEWASGNPSEAVELQQDGLANLRQELGEEHPQTQIAVLNLVSAYGAAHGRSSTAELEDLIGPGHEGVPDAVIDLALRKGAASHEEDEARSPSMIRVAAPDPQLPPVLYAGRAVDQSERILGSRHPRTISAWRLFARTVLPELPRLAYQISANAAQQSADSLGPTHVDTIGARDEMAAIVERLGESGRAAEIREENEAMLASEVGILGATRPPLDDLASMLSRPKWTVREPQGDLETWAGHAVVFPSIGELAELQPLPPEETPVQAEKPPPQPVRRAAHAELEPAREIAPGERFAVSVWVDTATAEDERSAELLLRPPPGVKQLELQVWLVVTPHFKIIGEPIRPLPLDLRKESSRRLRFEIDALHGGAFAAKPRLRLLFSHGTWLAGEVAVDVPLGVPAEATS